MEITLIYVKLQNVYVILTVEKKSQTLFEKNVSIILSSELPSPEYYRISTSIWNIILFQASNLP
jgi:hypothetical protein